MFPSPLTVEVGSSRQLRLFLAVAHTCSAASILLADAPFLFQVASLFVLGISFGIYLREPSTVRLRGEQSGIFQIWQEGKWQFAQISGSSVFRPGFMVLRTTIADRPRLINLIIMSDSMPEDDFRRLRVWLRWRSGKAASVLGAKNQHSAQ